MHDSIKYNAAVDSLAQQKEMIRHLSKYIEAERYVNRDVVRQNVALVREIEHLSEIIQKKSSQLNKSRGMLNSLMKEIDIKDDVLRSTQNQLLLSQSRYDEKVMESTRAPAPDPVFESLMEEHGLTKGEIVSHIKEYMATDWKAMHGQEKKVASFEKKVASLEKKVSTLQNSYKEEERKRKEAEKTVKDQKKQLDAKDVRIKMLEDSLRAQEEMTPAAPRSVTRAMEAVGNIMVELAGGTSSADVGNTPRVPRSGLKRHSGEGSLMSASESTGRGSASKRRIMATVAEKQNVSADTTNKAEPSHEADVSIWNPDSDKNPSDKENPSKMLSFDGKKSSSIVAGGVSKRKLLSVTSHNRKQPLMGVTKKNTGFSIPKLNQ